MNSQKHVAEAFSQEQIVHYYEYRAGGGLGTLEQELIDRYCAARGTALVVGCGTGREAFPLHNRGFTVVGIDVAWGMLHKAHEKCQALQAPRLWFHQGDVVSLAYQEECFDAVMMLSGIIQHIPKRQKRQRALQEIYRVLKPGGHLLLSALNTSISAVYLHALENNLYRSFLREQTKPEMPKQNTSYSLPTILRRLYRNFCPPSQEQDRKKRHVCRVLQRIAKECYPLVGSYSDPLPLWYRIWFSGLMTYINFYRKIQIRRNPHTGDLLEPNDFLFDYPCLRFRPFSNTGNLFVHFPDVDEIIEDLTGAGLTVLEYRSVEELRQGITFSERRRRSKRCLFYVAQKR